MSVNKVILLGRVGKDPEIKHFENTSVANFSLATSEHFVKDGEKKEITEWHNISAWGKCVGVIEKYVKKGDLLFVEGSIHTRKWEDKDGNTRYTTEVKTYNITLVGGKKDSVREDVEEEVEEIEGTDDDPDNDLPF